MKKLILLIYLLTAMSATGITQTPLFRCEDLQQDFLQFRDILENEHCCLYEYTPKEVFDSLFEVNFQKIDHAMDPYEYFRLLAPITGRIGCLHTSTWMPGRYFITKPDRLFPLQIRLLDERVLVAGTYCDSAEVPRGSIILEINGQPVEEIIHDLKGISTSDANNPYFKEAQLTKRFSLFYASYYGLPDQYRLKYVLPGQTNPQFKVLTPTDHETVRKVVFAHFNSPPLSCQVLEDKNTAIMKVETFIYYDKVPYFRNFMDSCFHLINLAGIENLILDLRGNDGGDPFCASILLSHLAPQPVPYFAESYGKYHELSLPIPLAEEHFKGEVYTLLDGSCGSTNGHFCALLKYHHIGTFVGTPSGSTFKCNAGKNTTLYLEHSQLIITIGRNTYKAAVKDMDKASPIMPDIRVRESYNDFLGEKDVYITTAMKAISTRE